MKTITFHTFYLVPYQGLSTSAEVSYSTGLGLCQVSLAAQYDLAETVRFELTDPLESTVFKTVAIDHSAKFPLVFYLFQERQSSFNQPNIRGSPTHKD